MLLVADSGSTKADWISAEEKGSQHEYSTAGFNPFFHDEKFVLDTLNKSSLVKVKDDVSSVKFFGAGCSSEARNKIIRDALKKFFVNADILVDHDMLACALATCDDKPGIAGILGTGSNVCYFDGKKIDHGNHGLGYIIGDEGSGSYYGKKLCAYYLYGILPPDLSEQFKKTYNLSKENIIHRVYSEPNANVFLAGFAKFLSSNKTNSYIQNLVRRGMNDFFDTNVCSYSNYKKMPVHFVGSIAFYFQHILREVAADKKANIGKIIQRPVNDLMEYFLRKERVTV